MTRSGMILALGALASVTAVEHAAGQTSTTGALEVHAVARDGAPLAGVLAVATASMMPGSRCVTDERGSCRIAGLPPGSYVLTLYLGALQIERTGVIVALGRVARVDQRL